MLVRINLPQMEHHSRFGAARRSMNKQSRVVALEDDRARAAQELPRRLADALPVLRFVEVCEALPTYWSIGPRRSFKGYASEVSAGSDEHRGSGAEDDVREAEAEEPHPDDVADEDSDPSDGEYSITMGDSVDMDAYYEAVDEHEYLLAMGTEEQQPPIQYRWMENIAYQRRWRVRPNNNARGGILEEISETELERAQRFLEEADDEEAARVDGTPLSHS